MVKCLNRGPVSPSAKPCYFMGAVLHTKRLLNFCLLELIPGRWGGILLTAQVIMQMSHCGRAHGSPRMLRPTNNLQNLSKSPCATPSIVKYPCSCIHKGNQYFTRKPPAVKHKVNEGTERVEGSKGKPNEVERTNVPGP